MTELTRKFEELYNQNRNDLYAFIIRSVHDENLALDLLQDSFVNFFQAFKKRPLPADVQCRMYLFRVARNLMINHGRKSYTRKVDNLTSSGMQEDSIHSNPVLTLEESVIEKMQMEEVEKILETILVILDEDEKMALNLRFQQNMKLEEIGQIMQMSLSGVSRLIQKASKKLMEEGKKHGMAL